MKIAVASMGYVGPSNAVLFAQNKEVKTFNLSKEKTELTNAGKSPIADEEISEHLSRGDLYLRATTNVAEAYDDGVIQENVVMGVYRLTMKSGSDNFLSSSIQERQKSHQGERRLVRCL